MFTTEMSKILHMADLLEGQRLQPTAAHHTFHILPEKLGLDQLPDRIWPRHATYWLGSCVQQQQLSTPPEVYAVTHSSISATCPAALSFKWDLLSWTQDMSLFTHFPRTHISNRASRIVGQCSEMMEDADNNHPVWTSLQKLYITMYNNPIKDTDVRDAVDELLQSLQQPHLHVDKAYSQYHAYLAHAAHCVARGGDGATTTLFFPAYAKSCWEKVNFYAKGTPCISPAAAPHWHLVSIEELEHVPVEGVRGSNSIPTPTTKRTTSEVFGVCGNSQDGHKGEQLAICSHVWALKATQRLHSLISANSSVLSEFARSFAAWSSSCAWL